MNGLRTALVRTLLLRAPLLPHKAARSGRRRGRRRRALPTDCAARANLSPFRAGWHPVGWRGDHGPNVGVSRRWRNANSRRRAGGGCADLSTSRRWRTPLGWIVGERENRGSATGSHRSLRARSVGGRAVAIGGVSGRLTDKMSSKQPLNPVVNQRHE